MIDFMYSPAVTKKLMERNTRVTGIDHHVTSREAALITHKPLFSLNNSGAVLAWKYFHPGKPTPLFLKYIEDRDLWRWKMPHSKEILSGTRFTKFTFSLVNKLVRDFNRPAFIKKTIEEGRVVKSVYDGLVDQISRLAEWVEFHGHKVLAVNAPHVFTDKLGNMLVKKNKIPFAIIWHLHEGVVRVSLRSDGKTDVSKIAGKYADGGGHKAAAGFNIPFTFKFPWKPVKK